MARLTAGEIKGIFFLFKKLLAYFEQREKQQTQVLEKQAIVYSRASHPVMCIHGTWGFC